MGSEARDETRRTGRPQARSEAGAGIRLGRIFGVEVRVDWSLGFIFCLIAFNLGAGLFPAQHPDWPLWLSWSVAISAAVLFFLSVLAHELAHAVVGRAQGVQVEGITLFIFGGMARIADEPRSARAEFFMAAVGPVTSFLIGLISVLIALAIAGSAAWTAPNAGDLVRHLGPVATLLMWLGPVNIILAIFNLLPGFPLDGGRVLRAVIWKATDDADKATRWSSFVGRAIAIGLMVIGVLMAFGTAVPFFGRGLVSGLWLVFIGWFLHSAAVQSYRQMVVREILRDIPVGRLMRPQAVGVSPELPVSAFVDQYLMRNDQQCFPVLVGDNLVGLVCLADLRKVDRDEWERCSVADIMTGRDSLAMVTPRDQVSDALKKISSRDVDQVPVVEEGHLFGVLRRADILRWVELQGATS